MVRLVPVAAGCLLLFSIVTGMLVDTRRPNPHLMIGGYYVLAADFHVHTFPLSLGVLSPWDTVLEAQRAGLDVIALTPHNETWVAKLPQWFSLSSGEPIVLVGEEIHSTPLGYHLLAIGIRNTIGWRQPAAAAIDEVHKQGGVAIAAHPFPPYVSYDAEAMRKLDGAEVVHPAALRNERLASELREFFGRAPLTAIGDSDYHLGPRSPQAGAMGLCRTFVFAREQTEKGVLDALRERRTIVYDREHVYGDPALIQLAAQDGRLPKLAHTEPERKWITSISGVAGLLGLLALIHSSSKEARC